MPAGIYVLRVGKHEILFSGKKINAGHLLQGMRCRACRQRALPALRRNSEQRLREMRRDAGTGSQGMSFKKMTTTTTTAATSS
ncbi:hypothetical protein [Nitrososphaera sp.]|uniref:hypothetical protein n=1 Tax=Nitrososphaera sp. TaxID=1971748 RepID=UPI00307F226D